MDEPNNSDKTVEEKKPKAKKLPGYRKFHKLLKQVIKAPPMKRDAVGSK